MIVEHVTNPYMSVVGPKLEDDLNVFTNERQLQSLANGKWKRASIIWKMRNILENKWKTPQFIISPQLLSSYS